MAVTVKRRDINHGIAKHEPAKNRTACVDQFMLKNAYSPKNIAARRCRLFSGVARAVNWAAQDRRVLGVFCTHVRKSCQTAKTEA